MFAGKNQICTTQLVVILAIRKVAATVPITWLIRDQPTNTVIILTDVSVLLSGADRKVDTSRTQTDIPWRADRLFVGPAGILVN